MNNTRRLMYFITIIIIIVNTHTHTETHPRALWRRGCRRRWPWGWWRRRWSRSPDCPCRRPAGSCPVRGQRSLISNIHRLWSWRGGRRHTYHALGSQSAFHQIPDGNGADEGRLKAQRELSLAIITVINDHVHCTSLTSRAVSAFSSSAPCLKMFMGAIDRDACTHTHTYYDHDQGLMHMHNVMYTSDINNEVSVYLSCSSSLNLITWVRGHSGNPV